MARVPVFGRRSGWANIGQEKVVQTFLLAYLNVVDYYVAKSEEEMGKGFADLFLGPFSAKYPELKYSYMVELKYMKRGEFTERKLAEHLLDAEKQLEKYSSDPKVVKNCAGTKLKCLALVFSGWELKAEKEYEFDSRRC